MATPTKVEAVTMVNNVRAADLSDDEIIAAIKSEQASIVDLEAVGVTSKHITKRVTEHKKSVAALVKLLDAR